MKVMPSLADGKMAVVTQEITRIMKGVRRAASLS